MDINKEQSAIESVLLADLQTDVKSTPVSENLTSDLDFLKKIFKEEVFSKITLSDLGLSLSELMLKFIDKDNSIPINVVETEKGKQLELKFNLFYDQLEKAGLKIQPKSPDLSLQVKNINSNEWELYYKLELSDDNQLESKKEELSSFYNELILKKEVFHEAVLEQELLALDINAELPISIRRDDKRYLLKVPIAKKGTYHHPVYNVLDFSEDILQTIEQNIKQDVVGYPIPITCGHKDDGAKKEGELVSVYREGDILFGEWEVNKDIYRKVEDGDITFSSSEFFPNYINKLTGEQVGRTLFGMALTNRPYMPNQPRVITLNDHVEAESYCFSSKLNLAELQYSNEEVLSNSNIVDKRRNNQEHKMPEEVKLTNVEANPTIQLSEQVQVLQQQLSEYHTKLAAVETEYKQKLSEYSEINEQLTQKVQKYEDRIKEEELNAKLAYLYELKLPTEITEKYTELIKNGSLGESEEIVLSSLAKLSQLNNTELFTQHGHTNSTAMMNDEKFEDPYAKVIEYNKKLAEARKMQTLASLNA